MSTQYRKALRLLAIGFSPLSVLWKVQAPGTTSGEISNSTPMPTV